MSVCIGWEINLINWLISREKTTLTWSVKPKPDLVKRKWREHCAFRWRSLRGEGGFRVKVARLGNKTCLFYMGLNGKSANFLAPSGNKISSRMGSTGLSPHCVSRKLPWRPGYSFRAPFFASPKSIIIFRWIKQACVHGGFSDMVIPDAWSTIQIKFGTLVLETTWDIFFITVAKARRKPSKF